MFIKNNLINNTYHIHYSTYIDIDEEDFFYLNLDDSDDENHKVNEQWFCFLPQFLKQNKLKIQTVHIIEKEQLHEIIHLATIRPLLIENLSKLNNIGRKYFYFYVDSIDRAKEGNIDFNDLYEGHYLDFHNNEANTIQLIPIESLNFKTCQTQHGFGIEKVYIDSYKLLQSINKLDAIKNIPNIIKDFNIYSQYCTSNKIESDFFYNEQIYNDFLCYKNTLDNKKILEENLKQSNEFNRVQI